MTAQQSFEQAREVAVRAHGDQRYGDKPYEYHLRAVVDVLVRFGATLDDNATAPLLIAAWLHDTLEDAGLERSSLQEQFGVEVAELVWRVTDEPGATRKERKPATYRKMRESGLAVVLKVADRIANVEAALESNRGLLRMYQREHDEFRSALRFGSRGMLADALWAHLERVLSVSETK